MDLDINTVARFVIQMEEDEFPDSFTLKIGIIQSNESRGTPYRERLKFVLERFGKDIQEFLSFLRQQECSTGGNGPFLEHAKIAALVYQPLIQKYFRL